MVSSLMMQILYSIHFVVLMHWFYVVWALFRLVTPFLRLHNCNHTSISILCVSELLYVCKTAIISLVDMCVHNIIIQFRLDGVLPLPLLLMVLLFLRYIKLLLECCAHFELCSHRDTSSAIITTTAMTPTRCSVTRSFITLFHNVVCIYYYYSF